MHQEKQNNPFPKLDSDRLSYLIMKRLSIFTLWGFVLLPQLSLAQTGLSISTNSPRHADILCKVEIPYIDAGERGEGIVWQFGEIANDSRDHLQLINSNYDTIAIYEKGRILHYLSKGDTLYYKGEQSRRAFDIYSQERPYIHYPFQFGDSIAGNYLGDCRNEVSYYTVNGFGYTVADGYGMLTDGEDTLRHVTRLHLFDDYVYDYGNGESDRIVQNRHLWYCAGYRYAVIESVKTYMFDGGAPVPIDSISYLFLPYMQLELVEDEANEMLLAELEAADAARMGLNNGDGTGSLSSATASLSSDGLSVTIHYSLRSDTDISFFAFDITGNMLGQSSFQNKEAGDWQEYLTLSRKPIGNVLMLCIHIGGQIVSFKVNRE